MRDIERRLAHFHRYQSLILERLGIGQRPDSLTDAERVELANRYLCKMAE